MYYCIWCSPLVVLAVVVWSWVASCVHCVKVTVRLFELSSQTLCESHCSTLRVEL